jgi:hypothetical protein
VQQRKGDLARVERLLRQPHHHRRVLADRVQHYRTLELSGNFPDDMDAFGLQSL